MEVRQRTFAVIFMTACFMRIAVAVAAPPSNKPVPGFQNIVGGKHEITSNAWMTHPWTASETPYLAAEKRIDNEIKVEDPQVLIERYKSAALSSLTDPMAQIEWAYLGFRLYEGKQMNCYTVEDLGRFEDADPMTVREYTQLRFALNASYRFGNQKDLEIVGERLLSYKPHDQWLREHVILVLRDNGKDETALYYAKHWVDEQPNSAIAHSYLGGVYVDYFLKTHHSKKYGELSNNEYRAYLRLAPANDAFRRMAEQIIKYQEDVMAGRTK